MEIFCMDFVDDSSCDFGKLFRRMKVFFVLMDNFCFFDYCNNCVLVDDICRFFCFKIINIGNEFGIIKVFMKEEDKDKDGFEVMEN